MDLGLSVVDDGVGEVEPAVIGVPLLAVHHGVGGVVGLGQLVPVLHFDQLKVVALFFALFPLVAGVERPAQDTVSGRRKGLLLLIRLITERSQNNC